MSTESKPKTRAQALVAAALKTVRREKQEREHAKQVLKTLDEHIAKNKPMWDAKRKAMAQA